MTSNTSLPRRGMILGLLLCGAAGLTLMAACSPRLALPIKPAIQVTTLHGSPALVGKSALNSDWRDDRPGLRRYFTLADLPQPYSTPSVGNDPHVVPRPDGAWPQAPAGFKVEAVATDLENPRKVITAPNGDLFLAESGANRVRVLRVGASGKPTVNQVFVGDLRQPFGMALYPAGPRPQYLYVANTNSVVRFPYHNGDIQARGAGEVLVNNLSGGGRLRGGGHWTRDIVFAPDDKKMYVSVGSRSNVMENDFLVPIERQRARIYQYNTDGTGERVYATGIRNAVGLAVNPATGQLWMSVNERDGLGDNLVPDYISHVTPDGFYGWPWYYMGGHPDERARGEHPNLAAKVLTPDVLLQPHSASLCMVFYEGSQFPKDYVGDAFASEHGSWNRSRRTGYKVIRVPMKNGQATGGYQDFLTGFVTNDGNVWGRPVGVTVGKDGSLFVTDDGSNTLWHVRYVGGKAQAAR